MLKKITNTALCFIALTSFTGIANATLISNTDRLTEHNGIQKTVDKFGNVDNAFLFDGVNDYVSLTPDTTSDSFSVAAFYKADGFQNTWTRVFDFGNGFSNGGGDVFVSLNHGRANGNIGTTIHPDNTTTQIDRNYNVTQDNMWHHVALTFDSVSQSMTSYFDGIEVDSYVYDGKSFSDWGNDQTWAFGRGNFNDPLFKGAMSHLFVSNEAISASDAKLLAQGNSLSVPEPTSIIILTLSLFGLILNQKRLKG